ncbi:phosphatase PAP2 family protein [Bergeyella sp. RCAD1439]|uniref:phosphatase PAP2 family protein n=1 Tax=Bergeyella anatis TaxID=3113737 RepID=UPI002E18A36D|nr:phosphatase PAP2 family protein [Bergeyella sp. RCAD1439]
MKLIFLNMPQTTPQKSFVLSGARVLSNLFNPIVSLLAYYLYFCYTHYTRKEIAAELSPLLLIVVLPIVAWITWNVKKRRYSNMDVSDRHQRKSLYVFVEVVLSLYWIFTYWKNGNGDRPILFLLLLLIALQISNYTIKSSMHTALNIFTAALFFAITPSIGLFWLGIALLVAVSRILLKRHTPQEVGAGTLIAGVISFIYLYIHFNTPIL